MNVGQLETIISLAQRYGATRLILFGSTLDTLAEARDLDLACDGVAGWQLYELAARLEEVLHTPVDLVPLTPASRFTRWIETQGRRIL